MLHTTVGIFGDAETARNLAKSLGKQGTVNDIAIYNHGSSEGIFTYVSVNSEKVHALLQVINMIDVPVIAPGELNAVLGEQIVAVSEFGFGSGFVLDSGNFDQLKPMIKNTCIENFSVVENSTELVESIKKLDIARPAGELLIPIDNYFTVKSVGTVVLGIIKSGTLKKYDKVVIEPLGKEVMIKGIQSQDKDIDSAGSGTRVGLNLKGIEADEIKRGFVVGKALKTKLLKLKFEKSKYTQPIKDNDMVLISAGLQIVAGKVKSNGNTLEVELESWIAYTNNTKFLIASTVQKMPRIMGKGSLQ